MSNKKIFFYQYNCISINLIKSIVLFFFLIISIGFFITIFLINNYLFSYVYEEWLINYSQGFVRRGLPGAILLLLTNLNLDIFKLIKLFSYITFLLVYSIYLFKVRQSKKVLDLESLIVVLFLPSLILFPLHDPNAIGRKEFLFFFGLFVNLFLLKKAIKIINLHIAQDLEYEEQYLTNAINQYSRSLFICYNLLSIPTALSHESIIFLALPLNMIITSSLIGLKFPIKKVLWRTLIIYFPTIFVTFLCLIFQGNDLTPVVICQSWQEYINQYKSINCDPGYLPAKRTITLTDNVPLVLQYIGLPIRYFVMEVWTNNIYSNNGLVFLKWISAFLLCTIILMRTSSRILINSVEKIKPKIKIQNQDNRSLEFSSAIDPVHVISSFSFKYAFIPFMFSSVLYIIAQDWGRWFFMTSTSYTICLLSPSLILIEIVGNSQNKWNGWNKCPLKFLFSIYYSYFKITNWFCKWHLLQRFYVIYFVVIIFTLFVLKIPHHSHFWDWSFKPWVVDLLREEVNFVREIIRMKVNLMP
ncbi:hypothetical protein [Microseira wollei]|uniref:Uncharacterized protein n=1 Tax=Microseira wollei NIES-4236 TaxID=2530354 RepID=A0AAV3X6F0_9CYAN|nr:hypothetical protein [Microseira wollei]GET35665.1 hypothetical protein MiSe_04070 [Microseira wollei NIES-4236]